MKTEDAAENETAAAENETAAVEHKQDAGIKDSSASPKDTARVTSPVKADETNDTVASKSSPGIMWYVCIYICILGMGDIYRYINISI